jgi:hypothetical protein
MAKRGKILRDPGAGPGLLMVEGQQYSSFDTCLKIKRGSHEK